MVQCGKLERSPGFGKRCHSVVGINGIGRGRGKKMLRDMAVSPALPAPQLGQEDEKQELRDINVSGNVSHFQKEKLKSVTCPRRECS